MELCVLFDFMESTIAIGRKRKETKYVVTLDMLDKIVKTKLRTNMKISNTKVGMQDLFYCDQTIPRRNGLAWIVNDNQKLAVGNALSAT